MATKREGLARVDGFKGDPRSFVVMGYDNDEQHHHLVDRNSNKLAVDPGFILDIASHGVKEPILVTSEKLDELDADGEPKERYIVVEGRHRVRALREVNEKRVAAGQPPFGVTAMFQAGTKQMLVQTMVACNVQRRTESILSKCILALQCESAGVAKLDTCRAMKITPETYIRYVSVAGNCTERVLEALGEERIGIGQAYELSKLNPEKQDAALKTVLANKSVAPAEQETDSENAGGNEGGNETPASTPRERVKKEREGVSIVELRKGLLSSAADALPLGIFVALNWVAGNRKIEVAEEEKEAVEAALGILDGFLEKARIEAAQPKKRGRKPKAKGVAVSGAADAKAEKIEEDFSGHVDPRLSDPDDDNDGGALDGGPDWSSQFDEDAENDPRESGESDDE